MQDGFGGVCCTHGDNMKPIFHDLTSIISCLNQNPSVIYLKEITRNIGYSTIITSGVLQHDNRVDEFIEVSVINNDGEEIPVFDYGYLTLYEPVFIHLPNGKEKETEDWLTETLDEINNMISSLLSRCFLIEGNDMCKGIFKSEFGLVEVQQTWKKKNNQYGIIRLLELGNSTTFPKIGDKITINKKKMLVVSLCQK